MGDASFPQQGTSQLQAVSYLWGISSNRRIARQDRRVLCGGGNPTAGALKIKRRSDLASSDRDRSGGRGVYPFMALRSNWQLCGAVCLRCSCTGSCCKHRPDHDHHAKFKQVNRTKPSAQVKPARTGDSSSRHNHAIAEWHRPDKLLRAVVN